MTTLQKMIFDLKNEGYESITIEMFEKNILPKYIEDEKEMIKQSYLSGEWMCSVKERLDYDHEDYPYNNDDEFYNYLTELK